MPFNEEISEEERVRFEEGGGVKDSTKKDREKCYKEFENFFLARNGGVTLVDQYALDPEIVSKIFSDYFWTMKINTTVSSI